MSIFIFTQKLLIIVIKNVLWPNFGSITSNLLGNLHKTLSNPPQQVFPTSATSHVHLPSQYLELFVVRVPLEVPNLYLFSSFRWWYKCAFVACGSRQRCKNSQSFYKIQLISLWSLPCHHSFCSTSTVIKLHASFFSTIYTNAMPSNIRAWCKRKNY